MSTVGIVVIGRNEGGRLDECFESLKGFPGPVVYVDSGSSDSSVKIARERGISVLELDRCRAFTAGRARSEGFLRLLESVPKLKYVQFVDGDCSLARGWVDAAVDFLEREHDVAVVFGRLRERYPERSIYNMLCDIEWDAPIGDAKACGGNSMMRASVFKRLNGFRTDLIAGEEPELCLRLRQLGLKIWRIPAEMGTHDAAILRFRQWWIRAIRAGHAHAQGKHLHRDSCERYRYHETRSAWTWGLLLPGAILTLQGLFGPKMFTLVLAYPIQVFRLAIRGGRSLRENLWWAGFIVLGKFPEMLGQLKFLVTRLAGKRSGLIEYK